MTNRASISCGVLLFCRPDRAAARTCRISRATSRWPPASFFADHRSARPMVEGTVARGNLRIDEARYTGKIDGEDIDQFPIPIAKADIERGQNRFNVYCTPCHGRDGRRQRHGGVARVPPAAVLLQRQTHDRLRWVISSTSSPTGSDPCPATPPRVDPDDRWRVIAYIRALQLSETAKLSDVPPDQRQNLLVEPPPRGLNQGPQPQVPGLPAAEPQPAASPENGDPRATPQPAKPGAKQGAKP